MNYFVGELPSWPRRMLLCMTLCALCACGGGSGTSGVASTPSPVAGSNEPAPSTSSGLELVAGSLGGPGNLDGEGAQARFNHPLSLALDSEGRALVLSTVDRAIRRVDKDGRVDTIFRWTDDVMPLELNQLLSLPDGSMLLVGSVAIVRVTAQGSVEPVFAWKREVGQPSYLKFLTDRNGQLYGVQFSGSDGALALFGQWAYRLVKIPMGRNDSSAVQVVQGSEVSGSGVIDAATDSLGRLHLLVNQANESVARLYRMNDAEKLVSADSVVMLDKVLPSCLPAMSLGYLRFHAMDASGNLFLQASKCWSDGTNPRLAPIFLHTEILRHGKDGSTGRWRLPVPEPIPQLIWMSNAVVDSAGHLFASVPVSDVVYKVSETGSISTLAGLQADQSLRTMVGASLPPNSELAGVTDVIWEPQTKQIFFDALAGPAGSGLIGFTVMVPLGDATKSGSVVLRSDLNNKHSSVYSSLTTADGRGGFFAWGERRDGQGRAVPFARPRLPAGLPADFYNYVPRQTWLDANGWVTENYVTAVHRWRLEDPTEAIVVGGKSGASRIAVDGPADLAKLGVVTAMAVDARGLTYFVDEAKVRDGASQPHRLLRRMELDGRVTTVAGLRGELGGINNENVYPDESRIADIAVDKQGNVYLVDTTQHVIRKVTPDGSVSVLIGQPGQQGMRLGALPGALDRPRGIEIDDSNRMYILTPGALVRVQLP